MFFYIFKCIKIFFKGFLSARYLFLNLCLYCCAAVGILCIYNQQTSIGYGFLSMSGLLFISIIYYDWRLYSIWQQYYYLFYSLNFAPFAIAVFNENNYIVEYNDIFQMLCENKKIKNFDELLEYFSEYGILIKALKLGIETIEVENSFSKDINFGDKIWRISMSSQFSKLGKVKSLFIIDITSDIQTNSMDKVLSNMLNYVDDGVIVTNRNGNIVFYNMSAANILKMSLIGKNIKSIPNFQNIQPNILNTVVNDTSTLTVSVNYYGEDYVLHRIKVANNQLDNIFIEAPFGILVLDRNLTIISYNKFFKKYFNTKFTLAQCVAPNSSEAFLEYIRHFMKNKQVSPASFSLFRENGPLVTIYLQFNLSDNINVFFVEDIGARDLKMQFLHEQRLYSLGEIVGSISHDFNNIVTTILSNCDVILERHSFSPANDDYIDLMRIKHSAGKAANLIKQILNISRKQTLIEETLNVNDILSELGATIGRVLGDNIDLKIIKKKTNINIFMNEVSFEQILINLLLNARDAMPYGGIIQITSDIANIDKNIFENGHYVVKGDYLEVCVCDSGIGISPDNIKKIFDPFFTTKKDKGTGFGLSTVNTLVKQKGGFIKVVSKLGIGTTFIIYLPIYTPQAKKTISYENLDHSIEILFVEDEVNILLPTIKGLKSKGFSVTGFPNGIDALKKGQEMKNLKLLISDMNIPKMDGLELYNELKKTHKDLKVIFTSGYSNDKISQLKDEKIFFLQKPYSLKDLYEYIYKCMAI